MFLTVTIVVAAVAVVLARNAWENAT